MTKKILFISFILLSLAQFSLAQKTVSPTKKKLAVQLSAQTIAVFPVQFFEDSFNTMNSQKSVELEKELSESLLTKLEKSNLTTEEKDILKPRITDFTRKISQMMKDVVMKDFNIKTESNKLLEKQYLKIFTLAELQKLNKFFKTPNGQNFVKMFNRLVTGELQSNKTVDSAEEEKNFEAIAKSLDAKIFVKFTDSLVKNTMDDIVKYVEVWANQIPKNMEKEMTNGTIKKEMDKFMAENFTK